MPVAFWLLRLAIRLLGLVSPALAGRWVYRLWFQPLRFPEPAQEKEWRRTAQPLDVVHRGQRLAVDSWGAGPAVLLVHGWNGRGAQLGAFAPLLVRAGFRVVVLGNVSWRMASVSINSLVAHCNHSGLNCLDEHRGNRHGNPSRTQRPRQTLQAHS